MWLLISYLLKPFLTSTRFLSILVEANPWPTTLLTQFVESILALKRYRFRQEDLINLLRTGLYTDLSQADIDAFEQYIRYLGINGLPAFSANLHQIAPWKI